jgi:iron complex transport system substrate-binding protein
MKRLLAVLGALALIICGCRDGAKDTAAPPEGWPVTVADTVLTAPLRRVVTLSPALTETVFALGYGRFVAGAGAYSKTPAAARALPACGTALEPDTAAIVSLRPDAVFTPAPLAAWAQDELTNAGIPVIEIGYAKSLDELLSNYADLCRAFEGEEQGALRERQLRYYADATLGYIRGAIGDEAGETNTVFLQRMDLVMATGDTLEGELLSLLGLDNPAEGASGWLLPENEAGALMPDVILHSGAITLDMLEKSPYYQDSPAVKNGRTAEFDGSVFEYQSPRLFFELEEAMKAAFPDGDWADKPSVVLPREEPPVPEKKSFWEKLGLA